MSDAPSRRMPFRPAGVGRRRERARGGATEPASGPRRRRRVWDLLVRVKAEIRHDDVPLLSAGVAFYGLLSLVPALVALVSVYGLVADPEDIERTVDDLMAAAPTEVADLTQSQLTSIIESSESSLTIGVVGGALVALWTASNGIKHLIRAINVAYDLEERRGWLRLRGLSLALTLGGIALAAALVGGLVALPNALESGGLEGAARTAILVVRWPLFAAGALSALAAVYALSPNRETPERWHWISVGAVVAAVVSLLASVGFSIYTANFGSYNETYGALGAIVVLMLWLLLVAYAIILGAEVNAEIERQARTGTPRDTTG